MNLWFITGKTTIVSCNQSFNLVETTQCVIFPTLFRIDRSKQHFKFKLIRLTISCENGSIKDGMFFYWQSVLSDSLFFFVFRLL